MTDNVKKLKFKGPATVIDAPAALSEDFSKQGFATVFEETVPSKNTLVFVKSKQEYVDFLTHQLKQIEPDSVLWFAYPKGTSKIKSDINRDILRVTGEEYGITAVSIISLDDTWSALRVRPIHKVGK